MMEKRNDCIQYLDEIIGKPICAMGRAANMLWIGIGEKFATTNWRGEAVEKSTYALHVQTGWRIVSEAKKKFYWRLFMPGKDRPHLVAYPAKMELE